MSTRFDAGVAASSQHLDQRAEPVPRRRFVGSGQRRSDRGRGARTRCRATRDRRIAEASWSAWGPTTTCTQPRLPRAPSRPALPHRWPRHRSPRATVWWCKYRSRRCSPPAQRVHEAARAIGAARRPGRSTCRRHGSRLAPRGSSGRNTEAERHGQQAHHHLRQPGQKGRERKAQVKPGHGLATLGQGRTIHREARGRGPNTARPTGRSRAGRTRGFRRPQPPPVLAGAVCGQPDQPQRRRMERVDHRPDRRIVAAGGERVLGEVVGPHREKVGLGGELVRQHRGRRHLDHHPSSTGRVRPSSA